MTAAPGAPAPPPQRQTPARRLRARRGYVTTSNPFKACQAGCCRTGTAAACFHSLACACHTQPWRSYTRMTLTGDW